METDNSRGFAIAGREVAILFLLLLCATGLFVAGLVLPMLTITRLLVFSHSFSVVTGVYQLWQNGHFLLFVIVAGFSVIMPLFKIVVLCRLILHRAHYRSPGFERLLHLMHEYGRWAMLDVMVVAVLIVTVKLGAIVSIQVHSGLFVFGLSALLMMLITRRVVVLTRSRQEST